MGVPVRVDAGTAVVGTKGAGLVLKGGVKGARGVSPALAAQMSRWNVKDGVAAAGARFDGLQANALAFSSVAALPLLARLTGDAPADMAMAATGPLAAAEFFRRRQPHPTDPGRSKDGTYRGADSIGRDRERAGVQEIAAESPDPVLYDRQVVVRIQHPNTGVHLNCKYDALEIIGVRSDGSLLARGWEIKPHGGSRSANQSTVDALVEAGGEAVGVYRGENMRYHGRILVVVMTSFKEVD